jgi:uncharacterized protein YneF (UPF0154 family)
MELSSLQIIGIAILFVIGAYIVVRLIAKAIFKSYFQEKNNLNNQQIKDQQPIKKEGGIKNGRV